MPISRRRFYPSTQGAIVLIAVVGVCTSVLRPQIPPPPENPLSKDGAAFFKSSVRQQIPWRTLNPVSMGEARRSGKPIFLFIGELASRSGRFLDQTVFTDPEVADFLSRNYFPIRVDATIQPYTASMFDPILRSDEGWDPSAQIWFLDSEGKKYSSRLFTGAKIGMPGKQVIDAMRYSKWLFSTKADPMSAGEPSGAMQANQATLLLEPNEAELPDALAYSTWLEENRDPSSGGWPIGGLTRVNSPALDFLLSSRNISSLKGSLDPMLKTGIVDWTGGGFFAQARAPRWEQLDFDKYAIINADMAALLSKCHASFSNSANRKIYKKIAEDTFDMLTTDFVRNGVIVPWRIGDEMSNGRSRRSSYSIRWLADANFDSKISESFQKSLGLNVSTNQAMVPMVKDLDAYDRNPSEINELIAILRKRRPEVERNYSDEYVCDIASSSVARLLETAVYLNDSARLKSAKDLFFNLEEFRVGTNDVIRQIGVAVPGPAYLGDYLGFSDAAMQMYRATGDLTYYQESKAVFDRAVDIFSTKTPGVLLTAPNDPTVELPPDCRVPEVVDRQSSSLSSVSIRLALDFEAAEFSGGNFASAENYRKFAVASLTNIGPLANKFKRRFSGMFSEANKLNRDAYVAVSGADSTETSHKILRQFPGIRIAPNIQGLNARKLPGVYLHIPEQTYGPVSIKQALAILGENRL